MKHRPVDAGLVAVHGLGLLAGLVTHRCHHVRIYANETQDGMIAIFIWGDALCKENVRLCHSARLNTIHK